MTFYEYVNNYCENYNHVENKYKTMIRYCFIFKNLLNNLTPSFKSEFKRDIDILSNDKNYLLDFEIAFHKAHPNEYKSNFFVIEKILSEYSSKEIVRPSIIIYEKVKYRMIELYSLNKNLTEKFIDKIKEEYKKLTPLSRKAHFKLVRKVILDSEVFHIAENLEELIELVKLKNKKNSKNISSIYKLHSNYKCILNLYGQGHDITRLYNLNINIRNQYLEIDKKLKNQTEFNKLYLFTKFINNHLDKNQNDEILISNYGLDAFTKNNSELLLKFKYNLSIKHFNCLIFILEKYIGKKLNLIKYDTRCLYVKHKTHNTATLRLDKLHNKSERFCSEFHDFFFKYLKNLKYHDSNEYTAYSNISTLRYLFTSFYEKDMLDKYGLNILNSDNYSYFRLLKSRIHEEVLENKIKINTKVGYFNALKWFCKLKKQTYIQDYDESAISNKYLQKKDLITGSYSDADSIKLLNYLIRAIKEYKNDSSKVLVLFFGLIIMLTGWNVSSLCSLKTTSLVPDQNNPNLIMVDFIKPRADYNVHSNAFFKNSYDKTIYLFLYVRDQLRSEILKNAINPEFQTDYLFVYLSKLGITQVAHVSNIVKKINEIIKSVGCDIKFNSKRVRKTYANQTYKAALKRFSVYKELMNHNFDVFVRHYEEINVTDSNNKLSNGNKALELYLKKEVYLEQPKIEESDEKVIKFTSIGNCLEQKVDNFPSCSDYMACIFCKNFSIVNTEAQIHKLLDFKNISIKQMMDISSKNNPLSKNHLAIQEFNNRIDYILNTLRENNPNNYNLAVINYAPNQYFSL